MPLPARLRKGTPDDLLDRHRRMAALGQPFEHLGSLTATMGPLAGGDLAVLHADLEVLIGSGPPVPRPRYFLSVVSADLGRACLDAPVPFTSDAPFPIPHFEGDTLVALARLIGPADSVRMVLYRYRVSTAGCRWVPLENAGIPAGAG